MIFGILAALALADVGITGYLLFKADAVKLQALGLLTVASLRLVRVLEHLVRK